MKNEITDKTFVLMFKGSYKIWITQKEAETIKWALKKNAKFVEINDIFFKTDDVTFILPAAEIDREDRIKRGEWKCEFGFWHQKGEQCGHLLEEKIYDKT